MRFKMCTDLQRNGLRHQNRDGVSYLLILRDARPKEAVAIWERLQPGGFTHRQ